MFIQAHTCRYVQAHLHKDSPERSHAIYDFEEHGPEKVSVRKHLLGTQNVAIVPVKPVKADIPILIVEGGVEATKIPHCHMKALDVLGRGQGFATCEWVVAVLSRGIREQARLERKK